MVKKGGIKLDFLLVKAITEMISPKWKALKSLQRLQLLGIYIKLSSHCLPFTHLMKKEVTNKSCDCEDAFQDIKRCTPYLLNPCGRDYGKTPSSAYQDNASFGWCIACTAKQTRLQRAADILPVVITPRGT